jgi:hypothetical protein
MNTAKHLVLPATLAYAGVRGSEALGITSIWLQIAAGILGAGLGLAIAKAV